MIAAGLALATFHDGFEACISRPAPYLVLESGEAAVASPLLHEEINAPGQQCLLALLVVSVVAPWHAISVLRSQLRRSAAA